MASGEKKLKTTPDILWMGKKEYLTNRIIREDNMKLDRESLREQTRFREKKNSSSTFKWRRETPPKLLRYSGRMKSEGGWANNEKNLKVILEKACDWWNPFLRQIPKRNDLRKAPEKLEESGKILGKDRWVRAH